MLLSAFQVTLLAWRWREIANVGAKGLPFASALQISFIGSFFSQVLPSTVGGDAARIWLFARQGGGWAAATYSVLIDRVVGVTALALIVLACLPWSFELVHDPLARAVLVLIGFGAVTGAFVFLALGIWPLHLFERFALTRHFTAASRMAGRLCRASGSALIVVVCSLAIHIMTIAVAWCWARAVAAPVTFAEVLFVLPPVLLIATVPISIAGWGVRESAMILAFSYAGLAESDGLVVSILFGLTTLAIGAIGGIVWIASGYRWRSAKTIEADTIVHDPSA